MIINDGQEPIFVLAITVPSMLVCDIINKADEVLEL